MSDFENVGRHHVSELIDSLESARPGMLPMFYHTLTFEGDLTEAEQLREQFRLPRPAERQAEIDQRIADFEAWKMKFERDRNEHKRRMRTEWLYWIRYKLRPHPDFQ